MSRAKPALTARAKLLISEAGNSNAMAELFDALNSGDLTRDETSGKIAARRCLESLAETGIRQAEAVAHAALLQEMRLTREAMKMQGSGATNFTSEQATLPRRQGKGTPSH